MRLATTAFVGLALGLPALHIAAAVDTPPSLMSRADHAAAQRAIRDATRLALARCRTRPAQEAVVCRAEARANERIAAAALNAEYLGTIGARESALHEQSRALHALAEAHRLAGA
jgi:hypothetical protein